VELWDLLGQGVLAILLFINTGDIKLRTVLVQLLLRANIIRGHVEVRVVLDVFDLYGGLVGRY